MVEILLYGHCVNMRPALEGEYFRELRGAVMDVLDNPPARITVRVVASESFPPEDTPVFMDVRGLAGAGISQKDLLAVRLGEIAERYEDVSVSCDILGHRVSDSHWESAHAAKEASVR